MTCPRPLVISGATGAVGWHLVRALLDEEPGRPLRLLVRPSDASPEARVRALFPDVRLGPDTVSVWPCDLARPDLGLDRLTGRRLLAGAVAVVHLAARTDFRGGDLAGYVGPNVEAAVRLGLMAARAGVPLVHASTAYVAGDHPGTLGEDDLDLAQGFHNAYERSMWLAEEALLRLAREDGLRLVRVRPGVVLPDAPVAGIPDGPGPLAYLRLLANLHGEGRQDARPVRATGDPAGQLTLVPAPWVAAALRDVLALGPDAGPCYHLTAAQPFTMADLVQALHRAVPGVRLVPTPALADPDPLERLVERAGAVYAPYRRLRARWDRARLVRDLPRLADDGADAAWLDRVFAAHLDAWRAEPAAAAAPSAGREAGAVRAYFEAHLPPFRGRALIEGLRSLTQTFSITVTGVGRWRVLVAAGRLVDVEALPPTAPPAPVDYALAPGPFLEAVAGARSPQALFFARAVVITGQVAQGLATATALEEFFRRFPYRAPAARARGIA